MSIILTIFLEGERDCDLFHHRIKHNLEEHDFKIETFRYRKQDKHEVNSYIDTIKKSKFSGKKDYIFLADLDNSTIDNKKNQLIQIYKKIDRDNIIIVCKEIEGWYLAGLSEKTANDLKINIDDYKKLNPNIVTKAQFERLKPEHFRRMRLFYISAAKLFDYIIARQRNESFNFFHLHLFPNSD
jgi:hypothetical protein